MFKDSVKASPWLVCGAIAALLAGCTAAPAPTSTLVQTAPPTASPALTATPPVQSQLPTVAPASPSGDLDCVSVLAGLDGRLAFQTIAGNAAGISTVAADGTGFRQVVDPGDQRDQPHFGTETPRWTADGRLVFSSNRGGGPDDWHIFVVDGLGGEPAQLTGGADGIEYHGVMSPDGTSLVYAKAIATPAGPDPFRDAGIFVSDVHGANERQLTTPTAGAFDEHPDISPDGTQIAFSRFLSGTAGSARSSIYVVNLDGTGLKELTDPELNAIRPRWSSDGEWIAFSSNGDNFNVESANAWLVSVNERGLRQLTHESGGGHAYFPDWSPDSRHLVYLHHREGSGTQDLAIIGLEGDDGCTVWKGTSSVLAGDPDWGLPL